mgnify:CR=1 FL=1
MKKYLLPKEGKFYKANLHMHTTISDGRMTLEETKEEYQKSESTSINHFYEKLLLLKNLMNTETGKAMAIHRHGYMESFLEEFYGEWEGKM